MLDGWSGKAWLRNDDLKEAREQAVDIAWGRTFQYEGQE